MAQRPWRSTRVWPAAPIVRGKAGHGLELIAAESGASARTVQRALRLLEVLGLVEVTLCYNREPIARPAISTRC